MSALNKNDVYLRWLVTEATIRATLSTLPVPHNIHGSEVVCVGDVAISNKLPKKYMPTPKRPRILSFQ